MTRKLIIMGAAGRDFHVFNTCYRDDTDVEVVAFTATQIPHISGRRYPGSLAGASYPEGIPIRTEDELGTMIGDYGVDEVVFAYSDVSSAYVTERQKLVESHGATFSTFDVDRTMLSSSRPVIAVTAVRTGCGKSQTARRVTEILKDLGKRIVVVRHPMPYGDLAAQAVQRFASYEDLDLHDCTIEEREEYESHIVNGVVVYAGVDYGAILARAEQEADVIIWDGGNNDTPFYRPDLWITVADPHRPGHELEYFPGTVNAARANVVIINKIGSASREAIDQVSANIGQVNPDATILYRDSTLVVPAPTAIRGKRVLAIEDGPTTTHGGVPFGAGSLAAKTHGAAELVDPRPWAVGEIAETFEDYPDIGPLLPAMGYGAEQVSDLQETVNAVDCDLVLVATPIDLTRLITINQPHMRITYHLSPLDGALTDAVRHALG
jgi:predicted GTPase